MPDLALVFLAVYGLVAFVFRILLQVVRTGSTGVIGVGGSAGPAEVLSGVLLASGIGIAVAGSAFDEEVARVAILDGPLARVAGVVLCVLGIVVTSGAQLAMGNEWRIGVDPGERTGLVTDGPFAIVRNPIYSGMVPFFAGVALLVPNAATIASPLLVLAALELQTRLVEEPYLVRTHGEEYERYAARVGRFFPGLGRR
jgi:protein-S-isoprenylcysteine O-methyltransferase Ste14